MTHQADHGAWAGAAEFKFADAETAAKGEFTGYASTFGNVDQGGDVIQAGAFAAFLSRSKAADVAMLWAHDSRSVPVGKWLSLAEDGKGLVARGQLTLDIPRAREIHAAMKEGTIKGLSIGYRIPAGGAEIEKNGMVRRIKTVDLIEISPVTFPMNTRAQISRVKAADMTIREFEEALRSGTLPPLSDAAAKAFLAGGYKALTQRDAGDESSLPEALTALLAKLTR